MKNLIRIERTLEKTLQAHEGCGCVRAPATKTTHPSRGCNTVWKASSDLRLALEAPHSTAESGADSPFGTENNRSNASFSRGVTKVVSKTHISRSTTTGSTPSATTSLTTRRSTALTVR